MEESHGISGVQGIRGQAQALQREVEHTGPCRDPLPCSTGRFGGRKGPKMAQGTGSPTTHVVGSVGHMPNRCPVYLLDDGKQSH